MGAATRALVTWVRRLAFPRSLRTKIVAHLLVILTTVDILTVVSLARLQIRRHDQEQAEYSRLIRENLHTKSMQLSLAQASALGMLASDNALTDMQNLVQNTVRDDVDVLYGILVKRNGMVVSFSAPGYPDGIADPDAARTLLSLAEPEFTRMVPGRRELHRFGTQVIEYSAPILVGDAVYGNLFYGVSTRRLDMAMHNAAAANARALRNALLELSLVTLGVTLLAIPLALRMARSLTRPIVRLTQASKQLSAGQRDVRVDIQSGDELETLGATFNTMIGDLERSYEDLESSNRRLQQEVLERKRAEDERATALSDLFQVQKMEAIGQLAGGVAHDFNNLLAVIQGNVDLLVCAEPGQDTNELTDDILGAVAHGTALTRQLLTFSRKERCKPQIISPAAVIKGFQKLVRRLISEQYALSVDVSDPVPMVLMDPGRLEQVLVNLTVNARDALRANGRISVRARECELLTEIRMTTGLVPPGRYAEVTVSDNGCGMTQATMDRIFEPFFTTKATGKGTGLGLATVHGIVGEAKGHLHVESEPDRGTSFRLLLPAVAQQAQDVDEATRIVRPQSGSGQSVMLCEDEESVRTVVSRILEAGGYRVSAFCRSTELLRELERSSTPPALLITDVIMTEANGKELAIAARAVFPGLRVLFISGHTAGVLHEEGFDETTEWFLRKPFPAQDLLNHVAKAVAANGVATPKAEPLR